MIYSRQMYHLNKNNNFKMKLINQNKNYKMMNYR